MNNLWQIEREFWLDVWDDIMIADASNRTQRVNLILQTRWNPNRSRQFGSPPCLTQSKPKLSGNIFARVVLLPSSIFRQNLCQKVLNLSWCRMPTPLSNISGNFCTSETKVKVVSNIVLPLYFMWRESTASFLKKHKPSQYVTHVCPLVDSLWEFCRNWHCPTVTAGYPLSFWYFALF